MNNVRNFKDYEARSLREATIVICLCEVDNEIGFLLSERSHDVGTHKGQVSFIGGHVEEGETYQQAAEREFREETGLDQ